MERVRANARRAIDQELPEKYDKDGNEYLPSNIELMLEEIEKQAEIPKGVVDKAAGTYTDKNGVVFKFDEFDISKVFGKDW